MSERPNDRDYRNLEERNAAYWREQADKLAEALTEITDNTYVGQAHKPVNTYSRFCNYRATFYFKGKAALAEYRVSK